MNQTAMLAEFVRRCDVDVLMVAGRYTLLDRSAEDELLPIAFERGVGVVAAAVFNSGLLATDHPGESARFDYQPASPELLDRTRRIADVCREHGVPLPVAALHYPLRHPAVRSVVVGGARPEQVRQNADRLARDVPDALWDELAAEGLVR
jgi:D-threo-aldose 1-dehydrogenase